MGEISEKRLSKLSDKTQAKVDNILLNFAKQPFRLGISSNSEKDLSEADLVLAPDQNWRKPVTQERPKEASPMQKAVSICLTKHSRANSDRLLIEGGEPTTPISQHLLN